MRLTVIFLLFCAFLIFKSKGKTSEYCHVEQSIAEQWLQFNHTLDLSVCCEVSNKQWELISWYFLRVSTYIKVTEIVREADFFKQTLYMSFFLEDLYVHTGREYYTHRVRYTIRDEKADVNDTFDDNTYQWHAELSTEENSTYYVEEDKLNIRGQILMKNWYREDEPNGGHIVLAADIEIIDHYLSDKKSRHPFQSKRAYYIILIYNKFKIVENWDRLASRILAKLWKVHGILNAIVMATCKQNNIGIYDPFANIRQLNITDSDVDEWGIFRCFPIKYLDYTDNWLVQKEYSLNGFPLTVSVFERSPTMVKEIPKYFAETHYAKGMKKSGYGGIDGFLLGNLAEKMNFTLNTITPDDNSTYGREYKGEFTGAIGHVLHGKADIAFNSRFLFNYGSNDIEYTAPVLDDKLCVVIPAAKIIHCTIFNCFDIYFWITFFTITVTSSIVFSILKYYQEKQERRALHDSFLYKDYKNLVVEEKINIKSIFIATWKVMIGINVSLPFGTTERLLIGSCLMANIFIRGAFESSLYTAYTKSSQYINTLSDFDKSGLRITTASQVRRNIFGNYETHSNLLRSLNDKVLLDDSELDPIERVAEFRDVSTIERYSDIHVIIKTKFLNDDGSAKLHMIKDCPQNYFLTYIVYRDWPLLNRLNKVLQRFAEGGFGVLWHKQTEEALIMNSYMHQQKYPNNHIYKPFSLKDIEIPFYILITGYIISFIVFLFEKFILTPNTLQKLQRIIWPVNTAIKDIESNRSKKLKNNKRNLNN